MADLRTGLAALHTHIRKKSAEVSLDSAASADDWEALVDGIESRVRALLASSAPATASEGATLSDSDTDSVTASEGAREDFCLACLVDGVELDHARCPLAPEHVAQAEKPPCVCPTDDYCPRCHPRWYANWIATGVTSSDGDRGLSDCAVTFVAEGARIIGCACGWDVERTTAPQAIDAHVEHVLAARTAQPEGGERVEWGVRHPQGIKECRSEKEAREAVAEFRRRPGRANWHQSTVVRRRVTPWEVVGDE